jgi:hypothetical protein
VIMFLPSDTFLFIYYLWYPLLNLDVDVANGSKMFAEYSEVTDEMLELREIVMARKEPRKLLVQPNMVLNEASSVQLKTYSPSTEGMIASWVDRFQEDVPELLVALEGSQLEDSYVNDLRL